MVDTAVLHSFAPLWTAFAIWPPLVVLTDLCPLTPTDWRATSLIRSYSSMSGGRAGVEIVF